MRALEAQFQNVNKQNLENFFLAKRMAVGSLFQEAYLGPNCSELPDLSLSALQKRFSIPSELEKLYKRYEQRFQIGKFFRQITSLQMYCQRVLLSFHGFFLKKWNSESQNISLKISFFTTFLPSVFMETIWKFDRFIQKESHLSGQNIMKPLIKRQKKAIIAVIRNMRLSEC